MSSKKQLKSTLLTQVTISRKEEEEDQTIMVLNAGMRFCAVHKQIPKGDKAFDVQLGDEGHTDPALPLPASTSSLTLTNTCTHTHSSPQKQLTF